MVLFGGMTQAGGDFVESDELFVYSLDTKAWTQVAKPADASKVWPPGCAGASAGIVGNTM